MTNLTKRVVPGVENLSKLVSKMSNPLGMPSSPTLVLNIDWCIMTLVTAAKLPKYRQMFELLQTHLKKRRQTDWCSDETNWVRKLIPDEAKLQIYKATILPHLTYMYCSLVWHFYKVSDQQKLEWLNHWGLRAVFCDWTSPYEELLKRARMKKSQWNKNENVAIFMFKTKHGLRLTKEYCIFRTITHTADNLHPCVFITKRNKS